MLSTYKLSTKLYEQTINEKKSYVHVFLKKQPQFFSSAWSCLAFLENQTQSCLRCCLYFLRKIAQDSELCAIA